MDLRARSRTRHTLTHARTYTPIHTTLSPRFLKSFENLQAFDTNPIYAVLHDAIYADAAVNPGPTNWAKDRTFLTLMRTRAHIDTHPPTHTHTTLPPRFLKSFENLQAFDTNPIYAVLHEAIYADAAVNPGPTNWAAWRVARADESFSVNGSPDILLTGEMVFPLFFDSIPQLRPFKVCVCVGSVSVSVCVCVCGWMGVYACL